MKKLTFPKDEQAHKSIIEWWYFNGHLEDKKGNQYSYMNCLFKADAKKVKLPFIKNIPTKDFYFSHSIISDHKKKKSYPEITYFSLVSRDSFSKPLLFINHTNPIMVNGYINSVIEQKNKTDYYIKNEKFDLKMKSTKNPLLESGNGYVHLLSKGSYYYSLTNLHTKGAIKLGNKEIEVIGKSWMDHQWADVAYNPKDKWTWFSIQLDGDIEIVCFEFDDKGEKTYLATISYKNNRQVSTKDVRITPLGTTWKSKKTEAVYPLSWRIEVPSLQIDLEVKPMAYDQEMIFGTINYWEGPLSVEGKFKNKKIKGKGFLELVGYPIGISNIELYGKEAGERIYNTASYIKEKGKKIIKDSTSNSFRRFKIK